ncbi:hypothetical protein predicted by Glimmer/Critica [Acetobacter senegalensis]|uniref:Uncharacterized protein n=1 Tax=Acetobacter senegalensis TaxID=446692 RepID=A0A0U5B723_9PROT|nr:hypothetical protein predicted by Glimmer/Critica [Acetobacter senegalensis]
MHRKTGKLLDAADYFSVEKTLVQGACSVLAGKLSDWKTMALTGKIAEMPEPRATVLAPRTPWARAA